MNASVLVMTCKKYKQCWMPFFTLLKKYWSDCPYDIIMGTDFGSYPDVNSIIINKDMGMVENLIYVLNKIETDKIIFFVEDFLPIQKFDSKRIVELVNYSTDNNIGV